ncbi:MAG: translation factor GTPase family protein, partial [Phycisphaeraceae bacterium]|nr:translation factor GTPase family protein [Phycisphaeraceae bacterium]
MSETQVESSKPAKTGGLLKTRNFGIAAHIDAGKTTVTERILFYTGRIHKMGEVHDGQATTDFLKDEQDRGITIQSAATSAHWDRNGRFTLNLIDTPGHVDFTIEVERSMRVLDGAVAVFDGKEGVEAQSETVWRQADRYRVPRICFINKMDKLGANFEFSFGTISERLGANPIAVQIPVGGGDEFKRAVIDLITMQMIDFGPKEDGSERQIKEIPDEWKAEAEKWRHKLVESVAELDDDLTEKFLEDQEITEDEIRAALRKGTLAMTCCPVLTGSALKSAGIQPLLDAIIDFLPAPVEVPNVQGTDVNDKTKVISRPHDASAPLSALVFKVVNDAHGDLTYTRIYSGTLAKGSRVFNPLNGKKENISRIYRMHANDREALDQATAGDIVALIGVKNSVTGDTLCDPDDPIVLERMEFPDPVISVSIEPQTTADREKLTDALITINREDPSFHFRVDEETGETIISGMGELHLD